MNESEYVGLFERKLVHHCTPTLAGMKPANLFVCRDESVPGLGKSAAGAISPRAHERNLAYALRIVREKLCPYGVHIELLARRKSGVLLYVYRPDMLRRDLARADVARFLTEEGYDTGSLSACIGLLHDRIVGTDLQSTLSGSCAFPHEIGLFLGYPLDDVVGFIENKGENYLCSGCWKVYSDERDAKECFCKYKECTRAYEGLFDEGVPIECLAALDDAYPAAEAFPQAS